MRIFDVKLKEKYPFLDINNADPTVTVFLQQEISNVEGSIYFYKRPAMIICPGGGYSACSLREGEPVAMQYLKLGFNVFVLYYSVVPHVFPQAIREVAATVDMINKNADEWNIDPEKVAVCGFSAGGHLAASYCTLRDCDEVSSVIKAKPVQAAVLGYPVISGDPEQTNVPTIRNLSGSKEITADIQAKFSLELHVSSNLTPPTFLWHTANDDCVPVNNSLLYAQALNKAGVPFELHIFPEGRHGLSTCDRQTNPDYDSDICKYDAAWITLADKWLKKLFNI